MPRFRKRLFGRSFLTAKTISEMKTLWDVLWGGKGELQWPITIAGRWYRQWEGAGGLQVINPDSPLNDSRQLECSGQNELNDCLTLNVFSKCYCHCHELRWVSWVSFVRSALWSNVSKVTNPWDCSGSVFSCPQQLNRWPCHSLSHSLSQSLLLLTLQSDPRDLWPLRHLIRVMRKHDLTNILTIF